MYSGLLYGSLNLGPNKYQQCTLCMSMIYRGKFLYWIGRNITADYIDQQLLISPFFNLTSIGIPKPATYICTTACIATARYSAKTIDYT